MAKHLYLHLKTELKNHLFDYLLLFTAGIFFLNSIKYFSWTKSN